jgi:lysozyme
MWPELCFPGRLAATVPGPPGPVAWKADAVRRHRKVVAALGLLLVLAVTGVLAVEVGWPHYRPPLRAGEGYGIDVSAHQGTIDWGAVATDGVHAAYVKATEGATFRDPRFEENWRGARAAGLQVGAYHFFTLCRGGAEQATNLLSALAGVDGATGSGTLPVAVDLELSGNCSARPPREQVQAEVDAFVEAVEAATGRPVVYYLLDGWADRYPTTTERPHWVRSMPWRPAGDWVWWQVNSRARVDGIDGPVDLNVLRAPD